MSSPRPDHTDADIVTARQEGRRLAAELGFSSTDLTLIATAISEVARNILLYAGQGEIQLNLVHERDREGIVMVARDKGPGIADVELAMQDGYSTGGSFGLGLPGARRLMDEFEIRSRPGKGVTVTMRKWSAPVDEESLIEAAVAERPARRGRVRRSASGRATSRRCAGGRDRRAGPRRRGSRRRPHRPLHARGGSGRRPARPLRQRCHSALVRSRGVVMSLGLRSPVGGPHLARRGQRGGTLVRPTKGPAPGRLDPAPRRGRRLPPSPAAPLHDGRRAGRPADTRDRRDRRRLCPGAGSGHRAAGARRPDPCRVRQGRRRRARSRRKIRG